MFKIKMAFGRTPGYGQQVKEFETRKEAEAYLDGVYDTNGCSTVRAGMIEGGELSEETKKRHVKTGGVKCPYCKSHNITGGFISIDVACATEKVSCDDCKKEWMDIYTLTGIREGE